MRVIEGCALAALGLLIMWFESSQTGQMGPGFAIAIFLFVMTMERILCDD